MAVISFYSYKGGSGRTTTTLNTLYYIIQETRPKSSSPLIIVDADNESYGMSMLLRDTEKYCPPEVSLQGLGVRAQQDTFTSSGNPRDWRSYEKLNKYFIPVGNYFTNDIENDAVLLLRSDVTPAEQRASWETVFAMNNSTGKESRNLTAALDKMNLCDCTVVFDTPSGTQDMATFSLDNSDYIVCCMRPSVQFEKGTRLCFSKFIEKWTKTGNEKNIIFCPSAVPFRQMNIDSKVYPAHYTATLFASFREQMEIKAHASRGTVNIIWDMKEGVVPGIPEVDRFKWQECCLAKIGGDKEDERLAKEKYQKLARILAYAD
ncbi:MAG: hypothetical protein K2L42_00365 [Clostridia bacterium]|nr:hypothetical protein [Clostridia bacterium]